MIKQGDIAEVEKTVLKLDENNTAVLGQDREEKRFKVEIKAVYHNQALVQYIGNEYNGILKGKKEVIQVDDIIKGGD